jgi:D-3-phosphoglycerate dehydrogenase
VVVRETKSTTERDYVNLIELAGTADGRSTQVAGTLYGKQEAPRIVAIDHHIVDLPPSSHMLIVRNEDIPGMIGRVGTILGDAGINIANMDVGTGPGGDAALMALSVAEPVPEEVVARLRAQPGILDARAIELD